MKTMLLLAAPLLFVIPASADVTVAYKSQNSGWHGYGASASEGERSVSGLKAREDADVRFTGAVLGLFAGKKGRETTRILRVDLDKRWELDPAKRTYTESPIKLPPPEPSAEPEEKGGKAGKREKPTHRIKSASASVEKTKDKKDVNGFPASRYAAKLSIVVEEIATKKTSEYQMTSDIWTTPWTKKLRTAADEEAKFQRAYLKKLGVELAPQDRSRFGLETARMLLAAAGPDVEKALTKLTREMGRVEGYPVLTESQWRMPAAPAAKEKPAPDEEGSALSDAAGAGSIGGAALGMLGGMAKRAASKKAKQAAEAKAGEPAFSVRVEISKVDTAAVPAERFELPKGYKKKG